MGVHVTKAARFQHDNHPDAGPFWFDGGPIPIQLCFAPDPETRLMAFADIGCTDEPGEYLKSGGLCEILWPTMTELPEIVCIVTIAVKDDEATIAGAMNHE